MEKYQKAASAAIQAENRRTMLLVGTTMLVLTSAFLVARYYLTLIINAGEEAVLWSDLVVTAIMLLIGLGVILFLVATLTERSQTRLFSKMSRELESLKLANSRSRALQSMASTLRATLSFELVVESALDVCSVVVEETGIVGRDFVGAVYLYEENELVHRASRGLSEAEKRYVLSGESGGIAESLAAVETVVISFPDKDPELSRVSTFRSCQQAICIPLRAGFNIFGAIILAFGTRTDLSLEQLEVFSGVADLAVVALQNAQLYQNLEAEKQRIIETEEEARRELARDLHDGPTQSVAAIVMRLNFVSSLMRRSPSQALDEIKKIETLAKQTSKEIRGMLFTLRPLILETEGLGPAIEKVMARLEENHGIPMHLVGSENGELINDRSQGVVFYIVEEALGNACKHSQASQIEVHFWQEDNLFVTRIEDDGVGFNVQAVNENYSSRGSLGMINMRERVELIDGSLKIESVPGRGTAITVVVPLDSNGRAVPSLHKAS